MLQLPVELQRSCIDFLSDDLATLKALRLVSKGFHELASESLFRTVSFTNVENSPERFLNIFHSSLRKHVRQAIINTSDHPDEEVEGYPDILSTFADAIAKLAQLEGLKRVELKFSSVCTVDDYIMTRYRENMVEVEESESFRAEIQDLCFQALAQSESFESLTIQNLQDAMPRNIMESKGFLALLPQAGDDGIDDEGDDKSDDEGDDEGDEEFDSFGLSYAVDREVEPDIRWHHLFERFRVGLQRLRYFKSGYSQDYPFDSRYNMRSNHPMNAYYSLDCRKPPGFEPFGGTSTSLNLKKKLSVGKRQTFRRRISVL
ncbi:uncharacterized protein J4E79_000731 [Alternaria viburni]|uniref:uncharacterized protein n=1 Tax=Alternaria viburni TaxID=566460 RepID=UPI0020C25F13|nr:uncharacterized protein J4E79_000731 [Alternaria viburni]KAI4670450.1 hypothetical protein J4E79_000731 [Alternaria viburni]